MSIATIERILGKSRTEITIADAETTAMSWTWSGSQPRRWWVVLGVASYRTVWGAERWRYEAVMESRERSVCGEFDECDEQRVSDSAFPTMQEARDAGIEEACRWLAEEATTP